MLAPTMTSLPSMTTGLLTSSMMRMASAGVSGTAVAVAVKDDEFVPAPARDQIARADDRPQPARDVGQQLVARAMAEAVIDLFEIVEVEEHHGQAVGRPARVGGQCEFVLEACVGWAVR